MKIEGLDYNTKREDLVMPEYGREIQNMVDHSRQGGEAEMCKDHRENDGYKDATDSGGRGIHANTLGSSLPHRKEKT